MYIYFIYWFRTVNIAKPQGVHKIFKLIKNISLPTFLFISILISANEENVEVNMENILEVGRENQTLSANSQDKIDKTERQTDKIVNEFTNVCK